MGGLLSELGKKLAERWLSLLVLPGAFFLAAVGTAFTLGHAHALDSGLLIRQISVHAESRTVTSTGGRAMILAAVLAGSAAAGTAVQALGSFIERITLAAGWQAWPSSATSVLRRWVAYRQRAWDAADTEHRRASSDELTSTPADLPDPATRHRAARRRERIAPERPERPTWSGDRIHAAAIRLDHAFHLDLATVWPHLWLVLPDEVRAQVTDARAALARAAATAAWSLLYALLALSWWPAGLLTAGLALTARHRVRAAADAYAGLLETVTRLHATTLADHLGLEHTGPLTPVLGDVLTHHLQVRMPPALD
ncbi:hypothetical protein QBC31_31490 [Streptomyces sp. B21-079]|uniref:hypothetical protein n=1 Tax=Streptomyces sp. B21-079 TaxID=3039409 RepID=UPI002FF28918